jgi:hypothetical protein
MAESDEADEEGEEEKVKSRGFCKGRLEEEGERGVPGAAHERLPPGSAAWQGHMGDNR